MAPLAQAACLVAIALACAPPAHGQVVAHGEFALGGVEYSAWLVPAVFVVAGLVYSYHFWYMDLPRKVGEPGFRLTQLVRLPVGGAVMGLVAFGVLGTLLPGIPYEALLADEGGRVEAGTLVWAFAVAYMHVVGTDKARGMLLALALALHRVAANHAPPPP